MAGTPDFIPAEQEPDFIPASGPAPPSSDVVSIGGQPVNLKTGEGAEQASATQAEATPHEAMRHAHGAVSFMGRPTSSQAQDEAFNRAWGAGPPIAPSFTGPPVEVPKGMEDAAHVAEKLPLVAGAGTLFTPAVAEEAVPLMARRVPSAASGGAEGYGAGREIGGMFGEPKLGGIAGGAIGAGYGLVTGHDPGGALVGHVLGPAARAVGREFRTGMETPFPSEAAAEEATAPLVGEKVTYRTDQNGTKWAKVPGAPAEVSVPKSLSGADAESYAREKLDLQSKFARRSGMRNLTPAMEEATGAKDLSKVPLRDQPFHGEPRPVGADVLVPPQRDPRAGVLPRTPPGSRVAVPIAEEFGPTAKAPGKFPAALTEEPARQMGVEPDAKAVEQARLEKKYPDRATRQMAHSQGDRIVDAVGDDSKLMKEVHDLTRVDLRQALINSGEDVGQRTVTDSKFAGEGGIPRKKAFEMLLDKGLTPREIVKLARKP